MEADPKVKERRLAIQRQMAMRRMMAAVPKAEVVITNPTEIAVALRYNPEEQPAPRVVAKGAGLIAEKIREIAIRHFVPLVEKKELARLLTAIHVDTSERAALPDTEEFIQVAMGGVWG